MQTKVEEELNLELEELKKLAEKSIRNLMEAISEDSYEGGYYDGYNAGYNRGKEVAKDDKSNSDTGY